MPAHKGDDFNERAKAAAKARQDALQRFKAKPGPDDPKLLALKAEREAILAARAVRAAEREAARRAEAERLAAEAAARAVEQAAREVAARAQAIEQAKLAAEAKAREAALEVERKAERDRRYAARKARR